MNIQHGKPFRLSLPEHRYLDISVYPHKWKTEVCMSVWEEGNPSALASNEKTYWSVDRLIGQKRAETWFAKRVNEQSRAIAEIDVIPLTKKER